MKNKCNAQTEKMVQPKEIPVHSVMQYLDVFKKGWKFNGSIIILKGEGGIT